MAELGSKGLFEFAEELETFKNQLVMVDGQMDDVTDEGLENVARRLKIEMQGNIVKMTEQESGELLNSIDFEPIGGSKSAYSVFSDAFHAPFVEFGTVPHDILPAGVTDELIEGASFEEAQEMPALRFETETGTHIVVKVRHPGTEPRPFFRFALNKAETEGWMTEELADAAEEAFERVFGD